MRARIFFTVLVTTVLAGCGRVPLVEGPHLPTLQIHRVGTAASPAPFVEIQAGRVQAIVPDTWDAAPLPLARFPQQGFVASPHIPDWERRAVSVNGMEAFWVDEGSAGIPSDYYYLVARAPVLSFLGSKGCRPGKEEVFVDHPPDLTGKKFSPSDYFALGTGTCKTAEGALRWAYAVAAPGFGVLRSVGIPTSGFYAVIAAVSGAKSRTLLDEMINGARFDNTSISQIERVAIQTR